MKVIARAGVETVLVSMNIKELEQLAGFNYYDGFNKAFGTENGNHRYSLDALQKVENIPVGVMYEDAKETLSAYQDLRTKFESIRNQLTILMKKMVQARPQNGETE